MRSLLAAVALLLAPVGHGQATTSVLEEAADALRRDPVYVSPEADERFRLSEAEAGDLREQIEGGERPVFVAILPASAGDPDVVPRSLAEATGLAGTYAVVVGGSFRAGSTQVADAAEMASAAFQAERDNGVAAVLSEFVARVQAGSTSGGAGGEGGEGSGDGGDGSDGGVGLLPVVLLVGGGGVAAYAWSQSRKRRRRELQVLEGDKQDLQAEVAVLAEDVLRLEPEVAVHPEARNDYDAAVARYRWVEAAVPSIDSPDDPPRIRRALTEAQYSMRRVQAMVHGHEPPPPPDELTQPGRYGEPAVVLDERNVPQYAGYGGGWYGGGWFGGNDLFTGLLIGTMLGGGFGGFGTPFGWGHGMGHGGDDGNHDGGGGLGGFDVGGGDWGGGDFDVGGGDWD